MLTDDEKSDLSDAMNEFARFHNIPVMSPVWASRIGLISSVAAIGAARADMLMGQTAPPAPAPVAHGPAAPPPAPEAPRVSDWFVPEGAAPN